MSVSENVQHEAFKTRVLIYSSSTHHAQLIQKVLKFHNKDVDWFGQNSRNTENDFVVLQTSEASEAAGFNPTIVLVSSNVLSECLDTVFNSITPGGVLVYPETIGNIVENTAVYFRKLPYASSDIKQNADVSYFVTELGDIPVFGLDSHVIDDLQGIKLFCVQFGIMEEEFFEALAELLLN